MKPLRGRARFRGQAKSPARERTKAWNAFESKKHNNPGQLRDTRVYSGRAGPGRRFDVLNRVSKAIFFFICETDKKENAELSGPVRSALQLPDFVRINAKRCRHTTRQGLLASSRPARQFSPGEPNPYRITEEQSTHIRERSALPAFSPQEQTRYRKSPRTHSAGLPLRCLPGIQRPVP